jgi:hypothetical protein
MFRAMRRKCNTCQIHGAEREIVAQCVALAERRHQKVKVKIWQKKKSSSSSRPIESTQEHDNGGEMGRGAGGVT